MKILIKGKVETVSLDRVKPAHFECVPATGTNTQRTAQPQKTSSKTTGITRGNPQDTLRPSSMHTQRSKRTSVKPTTTQSTATKIGTNLATAPQQNAKRVKLLKQFKLYVAPHSRTPAVSRANGNSGALRTYSRVPLHLRGITSHTSDSLKQSNGKSNSNIADSDEIIADATVKKTRVGRTIQTPARFVQMVHAIVAPNDIYGRTNRTYRSNNNYNL